MKSLILLLALLCFAPALFAQKVVYTINADSTKLTGCDSNELIIENHTQNVPGFLFNTGKGRTIFKRGVIKLNDSSFVIGGDTLKSNAWLQGGNRFGALGILGTLDNNSIDLYTNNTQRMRLTNLGRLLIGTTTDNNRETVQLNGSMYTNGYISNFLAPSGTTSGALRLRWGTGDGSYISFYKQANTDKRAFFGTPSDTRPFYIFDSVGVSFSTTPKITIGNEQAFNNAKLSILKPYTQSTLDVFNCGRLLTDTTSSIDLQVLKNGNTMVGPGTDNGIKFQVNGSAKVSIQPNLSRSTDQILIGGYNNTGDGQNNLISTWGSTGVWKAMICERDGNLGLGLGGTSWIVGSPSLRISSAGAVSMQTFYFGNTNGPTNSSALTMSVSNTNEWTTGTGYPSGQNYYNFGTVLMGGTIGNKRASLHISADQLQFMTGSLSDTQRAVITESGSFGLGTATPTAQLHTTGTVRFAGLTEDSTQTRVLVSDASGNLYYRSASSLAANDILRSALAVNGTITAKELRLSRAGWADYVFDSTYTLMPLSEVDGYIHVHRHLPGIPSAAEVARDGVAVGETQTALLKKIEELTLYTIEQDKKIAAQQDELQAMKAELSALKKLILEKSTK